MADYVCETCGRLGAMSDFQDDCRPGWTHGRLIRVTGRAGRKPFAGRWDPTPEQRKRASDLLLDLWDSAEVDGDEETAEVVKKVLMGLGLPWVRISATSEGSPRG